jgi:hypothetical protein
MWRKAGAAGGVLLVAVACGGGTKDHDVFPNASADAGTLREAGLLDAANAEEMPDASLELDAPRSVRDASSDSEAGALDATVGDASDLADSEGLDATNPNGKDADAGPILHHYDVWFDPPVTVGCELAIAQNRLNLSLQEGEPPRAYYFEDFRWWQTDTDVVENGATLEITPTNRSDETRPTLTLDWNGADLVGTGAALAVLTCADGVQRQEQVLVHVTPDVTPPRVRARPYPDVPMTFSFSSFMFMISEIDDVGAIPVASIAYPFNTIESTEGRVSLIDDATGLPLPITIEGYPFGPAAIAVFNDRDAVGGHITRVSLNTELYDSAGNRAVADDTVYPVYDVGPALPRHDFDAGSQGVVALPLGNATVHEPSTIGSPCESGGCLEFHGPLAACDPSSNATASALAFRLNVPSGQAQIRYRLWTSAALDIVRIRVLDGPCQVLPPPPPPVSALPVADGAFTHATEWTTQTISTCLVPSSDVGLILGICGESIPSNFEARMVVEWIEAVATP